jgi:hypothetical protein
MLTLIFVTLYFKAFFYDLDVSRDVDAGVLRGMWLSGGQLEDLSMILVDGLFYTYETMSVLMSNTEGTGQRLVQLPMSSMQPHLMPLRLSGHGTSSLVLQDSSLKTQNVLCLAGPVSFFR